MRKYGRSPTRRRRKAPSATPSTPQDWTLEQMLKWVDLYVQQTHNGNLREFARVAGLKYQWIYQLLVRNRAPKVLDPANLVRLARAIGTTVDAAGEVVIEE